MRLADLAELCEAQLIQGDPDSPVRQVSTDTRAIERGDCFIALEGPHFDGHEFLDDAAQRGGIRGGSLAPSYPCSKLA